MLSLYLQNSSSRYTGKTALLKTALDPPIPLRFVKEKLYFYYFKFLKENPALLDFIY